MANPQQITLDPIRYLNNLPQFNGNRNDLMTFTRLIDRIYPILATYDELSQLLFSDIIKSRLVGRAKEVIEINTQVLSWEDIKRTLQNNFGERKNCEELYDDLRAVTFHTNTIDFYNDIKYRLRCLNNKSAIVLGEGEASNHVALNNQRTALHIFKNKIPEPMKTILACRNPTSLEAAMDIMYENGYDQMGKDGHIYRKTKQHKDNYNTTNNKKKYQDDRGRGNYQQNDNNRENPRYNNYQQNNSNRENPRYGNYQQDDNSRESPRHSNYRQNDNNRENQRRSNYRQNDNRHFYRNNEDQRWPNNQNHNNNNNQTTQPRQSGVEPMDVNNVENFQQTASTENYPI